MDTKIRIYCATLVTIGFSFAGYLFWQQELRQRQIFATQMKHQQAFYDIAMTANMERNLHEEG
jgi:hypothetical protein